MGFRWYLKAERPVFSIEYLFSLSYEIVTFRCSLGIQWGTPYERDGPAAMTPPLFFCVGNEDPFSRMSPLFPKKWEGGWAGAGSWGSRLNGSVQHGNPCPQGKVRVQWLCHLNDCLLSGFRFQDGTFRQPKALGTLESWNWCFSNCPQVSAETVSGCSGTCFPCSC